MKLFYKITLFLALMTAAALEAPGQSDIKPTIKEQMQKIHLHFDINFIYDSSISLYTPLTQNRILKGRHLRNALKRCSKTLASFGRFTENTSS